MAVAYPRRSPWVACTSPAPRRRTHRPVAAQCGMSDGGPSASRCAAPHTAAACSRRLAAAALLAAAAAWPAASPPARADAGSAPDAGSFYARWPYVQPGDILPYLRATAAAGDVDSVLAGIDRFAGYYPMYRSVFAASQSEAGVPDVDSVADAGCGSRWCAFLLPGPCQVHTRLAPAPTARQVRPREGCHPGAPGGAAAAGAGAGAGDVHGVRVRSHRAPAAARRAPGQHRGPRGAGAAGWAGKRAAWLAARCACLCRCGWLVLAR